MGEKCCKNQKTKCESEPDSIRESTKSTFIPDHETQEPIFPPELKKVKIEELTIKGPRATWYRPTTLDRLMAIRCANPTSKIITGNTECGVETKFRGLLYPHLISPVAVSELNAIQILPDRLHIGASSTLTEIDRKLRGWIKAEKCAKTQVAESMCEILTWFAGDQIRNVSAIGGNLMTASPISDLAPILMASGASVQFGDSPAEIKSAEIDETFFTGYRKTVIPNSSTLLSISIPHSPENSFFRAYKQSKRKEDDIAIVNGAFFVEFEPNSTKVKHFRASYGGMAPTTKMATKTNSRAIGLEWDDNLLRLLTDSFSAEFDLPPNCPGGFVAYRKCLVTSLFFKFFITVQAELAAKKLVKPSSKDDSAIGEIVRPKIESLQSAHVDTSDAVGQSMKVISAGKQVSGQAVYVDDIPPMANEAYFGPVLSNNANAKILSIDWTAADELEGVIGHVDYNDVPGNGFKIDSVWLVVG